MRGAGDDRRRVWRTFASATSNVRFASILAGHQHLAIGEIGWWFLATAAVLFLRRNDRRLESMGWPGSRRSIM